MVCEGVETATGPATCVLFLDVLHADISMDKAMVPATVKLRCFIIDLYILVIFAVNDLFR